MNDHNPNHAPHDTIRPLPALQEGLSGHAAAILGGAAVWAYLLTAIGCLNLAVNLYSAYQKLQVPKGPAFKAGTIIAVGITLFIHYLFIKYTLSYARSAARLRDSRDEDAAANCFAQLSNYLRLFCVLSVIALIGMGVAFLNDMS